MSMATWAIWAAIKKYSLLLQGDKVNKLHTFTSKPSQPKPWQWTSNTLQRTSKTGLSHLQRDRRGNTSGEDNRHQIIVKVCRRSLQCYAIIVLVKSIGGNENFYYTVWNPHEFGGFTIYVPSIRIPSCTGSYLLQEFSRVVFFFSHSHLTILYSTRYSSWLSGWAAWNKKFTWQRYTQPAVRNEIPNIYSIINMGWMSQSRLGWFFLHI